MNWQHIKAIFLSGIQMWLSDKRSIVMRLIVWPNAVPSLFCVLFIVVVVVMSMRTSAPGGDMSVNGGIAYAIEGGNVKNQVAKILSTSLLNYQYVPLDNASTLEQMISNKEITFGLAFVEDINTKELNIILKYDRQRDYPHTGWIQQTKDKLSLIALEVRKERLKDMAMPSDDLAMALAPINFSVEGFGANEDVIFISALTFLLWGCLLMLPIEACASITSQQMLSDTCNDFMSVWKCAGVKPLDIVMGRLLTSSAVYIVSFICFMTCIIFWIGLYCLLVGYLVPMIPAEVMGNPHVYNFTIGFVSLIDSVTLSQMFLCFILILSVAILMLAMRLRLSIYVSNLEQVRTKLQGFDFVILNMPVIGFVLGAIVSGYATMSIPVFNGVVALSNMFKSDLVFGSIIVGVVVNLLLALCLLMLTARHIDSQKRQLTCY